MPTTRTLEPMAYRDDRKQVLQNTSRWYVEVVEPMRALYLKTKMQTFP